MSDRVAIEFEVAVISATLDKAAAEIKFGTGVIRGFSWGTIIARAALEYAAGSSSQFDAGEYALEYVRRLGPRWRIYAGLEGTQDEVSAIGELQLHVNRHVVIKATTGIGLTSKATDFAPEDQRADDSRAGTRTLRQGRVDRTRRALGILPRGPDGADRTYRPAVTPAQPASLTGPWPRWCNREASIGE